MTKLNYKYADFARTLLRQIAVDRMMPGDRLPSEEDMGRQHGLSRITVRRALRMLEKDGYVSRKRPLGTFVARSLQDAGDLHMVRGTVIVAIPSLTSNPGDEDHALTTVLRGMEEELAQVGFSVHVLSLGRDERRDRGRLTSLMEHGKVEGICAVGSCFDRFRHLVGATPLVNSCTFFPDQLPWVGVDMSEAAFSCIRFLLDHGHRDIATIIGPWVDLRAMGQINLGHRRAFEQHGVPFRRTMVHQAYEGESIIDLATEILRDKGRPTAIFAEDWRITRAILFAAQNLGLRIPQDLSLVACGQNNLFVSAPVSITAYLPDNEQVGREAARTLVALTDGGLRPSMPLYVPGRVVEQQSVCRR